MFLAGLVMISQLIVIESTAYVGQMFSQNSSFALSISIRFFVDLKFLLSCETD